MLHDYGWSRGLQRDFAAFEDRGLVPARVIAQHRGRLQLMFETGEADGRLAGRLRDTAEVGGHPAVGDWVAAQPDDGGGLSLVHAVLPRRTAFIRRAAGGHGRQVVAANVDVALIVQSLNADLNPRRLERYLAAAYESGADPVVVLTKADLRPDPAPAMAAVQTVAGSAPVLPVSAVSGLGLDALRGQLEPRRTAALLGSSGVGKSTLVNALAGEDLMRTGEVRDQDARGRHTTTHREILRLPWGALILDSPGMRELGLVDAADGLERAFGDLSGDVDVLAGECRFADCRHGSEPGCAVQAALAEGRLDRARFDSWRKLQRELAHEARKDDAVAREVQRREWMARAKAGRKRGREKQRGFE